MNLKQLHAAREAAGKQYAFAVSQLREAYITLASLDLTLANYGINDRHADVRSFHPLLDNAVSPDLRGGSPGQLAGRN